MMRVIFVPSEIGNAKQCGVCSARRRCKTTQRYPSAPRTVHNATNTVPRTEECATTRTNTSTGTSSMTTTS
eukprot:scaffold225803_cov38-Prasinocladus_malaysianus.AAC.3